MKKSIIFMMIALGTFVFSGCSTHTFSYDYDELMQNLTRAEVIYIEEKVDFFEVHWYVGFEKNDYEVVAELNLDDVHNLLTALVDVRFSYSRIWLPVSVSRIYSMQGYAIKLHYEDDQFIIVGQTGDYRQGLPRFAQILAGRRAADEDWNNLFSDYLD